MKFEYHPKAVIHLSTKKGKAKPRCFVCGTNMKEIIRTEIACPKCGSKLREASSDEE